MTPKIRGLSDPWALIKPLFSVAGYVTWHRDRCNKNGIYGDTWPEIFQLEIMKVHRTSCVFNSCMISWPILFTHWHSHILAIVRAWGILHSMVYNVRCANSAVTIVTNAEWHPQRTKPRQLHSWTILMSVHQVLRRLFIRIHAQEDKLWNGSATRVHSYLLT